MQRSAYIQLNSFRAATDNQESQNTIYTTTTCNKIVIPKGIVKILQYGDILWEIASIKITHLQDRTYLKHK